MRSLRSLLLLAALTACSGEHPSLTHAEARLHLLRFYAESSGGLMEDVAAVAFTLQHDDPKVRYAFSHDGQRLATFRLSEDGSWEMTADPFLVYRLKQLAADRSSVTDLVVRVDSAEVAVADFEAALPGMIHSERGTEPWRWRLEQARAFLTDMEEYVGTLDHRAQQLAGATNVWARCDTLLHRLRTAQARIDRQLEGR
jgi:hypothetical protein